MKNVLVTGGAGGIGSSIVKAFIKSGYFVYIVDTDVNGSKELVAQCGKEHCCAANLDVTDTDAIKNFIASLGDNITFNHIVTLAGRALEGEWLPFGEQSLQTVEKSVKLNLLGHINIIHAFLPLLKKADGDRSILMISTINASQNFGLPAYSAAKSGLYGLMNGIVGELGEMGIRINTVSPGTVLSPATEKEPKNFDKLLKTTAINKFATSDEVADVVVSVCDRFISITGQNIIIDAGQSKTHDY